MDIVVEKKEQTEVTETKQTIEAVQNKETNTNVNINGQKKKMLVRVRPTDTEKREGITKESKRMLLIKEGQIEPNENDRNDRHSEGSINI